MEVIAKVGDCKKISLVTAFDDMEQKEENTTIFEQIVDNLFEHNIEFRFQFSETLYDREIKLSNGWGMKMGRVLDYFQSLSGNYYQIGVNDMDLRPCLETNFDFYKLS